MIKTALTVLLVAASLAPRAFAELKVVTTIPDLADIAREIGGERVSVTSICRGRENIHSMRPAPSDLVALSRADLFVQQGLALEATWLPGLLLNARNRKIEPGAAGFVSVSEGWEAIQVPESLSRFGGDLHPFGNPHLNLDPRAGRHIAGLLLDALSALEPGSSEAFEANHAAYLKRLDEAEARWAAAGESLRGGKLVEYHQEFDYLAGLYGVEVVERIELKPGIPPTAAQIARVIKTMEHDGVSVIVTAAWSNNKQVKSVAQRTGATVVELPTMVGGAKGADTWIAMMDVIHERLAAALAAKDDEGAGGD